MTDQLAEQPANATQPFADQAVEVTSQTAGKTSNAAEQVVDHAANAVGNIADQAVNVTGQLVDQAARVLEELAKAGSLRRGNVIVVGVSTSEVQGRHIGTAGTEAVAAELYNGVLAMSRKLGLGVVWQCCEHLNRALACERGLAEANGWTIVSAVPVPKAGGSMAAYAYRQMQEPCLVEHVQVQAGIDIGETMIGMHLRAVAVPFRPSVRWIGEARVGAAYSRPKLIGGARAVYELPEATSERCD